MKFKLPVKCHHRQFKKTCAKCVAYREHKRKEQWAHEYWTNNARKRNGQNDSAKTQ